MLRNLLRREASGCEVFRFREGRGGEGTLRREDVDESEKHDHTKRRSGMRSGSKRVFRSIGQLSFPTCLYPSLILASSFFSIMCPVVACYRIIGRAVPQTKIRSYRSMISIISEVQAA